MHITIIGTGYVGLVTGACFAEMGNHVTCIDVDQRKLDDLNKGLIPIYEPGLEDIVKRCFDEGLLKFSSSLSDAMKSSDVYFIAVGTPPGEDGSADLKFVISVAEEIGDNLDKYAVIVDKSTVPVGTADKVKEAIQSRLEARGIEQAFDVVSNPEFLKEGAAVDDFLRPDRIVIGSKSARAREVMKELYAPFARNHEKLQFMGVKDAEMTKYAANAMLATKISFMNEIANLCERMGVDVENVRKGIGSDSRIGYSFIYPGCGYGGSCFPKDVKAIVRMAEDSNFTPDLLNAVESRNEKQKRRMFEKVVDLFGADLTGHTFAIWGLAFKPGTDDVREASAIILIKALIGAGAKIKAYDPVAKETAAKEFPPAWIEEGKLQIVEQQYEPILGASALILVTEWKMFRQPDFVKIKKELVNPIIFDGRNQYDPERLDELGFQYWGIGRRSGV
ncbi:MAG: UDP-glucose/GDP-mannose dehydrogenase family protein [Pseudomonadales bacterium]|nr:UDP-glucose/GDP-mannose dehydrogenase family protein [Pseudomonadales bacterium]